MAELYFFKEAGDIVQTVGIPVVVILYYMYKDYKQGERMVEAMQHMVVVAQQMVSSNAQMVTSNALVAKDVDALKARVDWAK